MSKSEAKHPPQRQEPEIVTDWPTVGAVAGLILATVVFSILAIQNAPTPEPFVSTKPAPHDAIVADEPKSVASPSPAESPKTRPIVAAVDSTNETAPSAPSVDVVSNARAQEQSTGEQPAIPDVDEPPASEVIVSATATSNTSAAEEPSPSIITAPSEPTLFFDVPSEFANQWRNEPELLASLTKQSTEVKWWDENSNDFRSQVTKQARMDEKALMTLRTTRPEFFGLPFRMGYECRTSPAAAKKLGEISVAIAGHRRESRRLSQGFSGGSVSMSAFASPDPDRLIREQEHYMRNHFLHFLSLQESWNGRDSIPAFIQILQAEPVQVRENLVVRLARIKHQDATNGLVQRVLFDPSRDVRKFALESLALQPIESFRAELMAGFDHPWKPARDHAAFALVALDDRSAIKPLTELLKRPGPDEPFQEPDGKWYRRELVRVNHLANCRLCHAAGNKEPKNLIAAVPVPGQRIREYYRSRRSLGPIRADIVYLKQDFSAVHQVDNPGPWPASQRFDYLVRKTPLKEQPKTAASSATKKPDRAAAKRALDVLMARRDATESSR